MTTPQAQTAAAPATPAQAPAPVQAQAPAQDQAPAAAAVESAMASVAINQSTMVYRATIDARFEAQKCKIAMKGLGTDNKAIIEVLTTSSNEQRQAISKEYKVLFGKDLIEDIHSETSGNFRKTCEALLRTPAELDAESIRNALKGLGTDEECLIEILCTSTNEEINAMKECYTALFNRDVEKDVKSDTSGNLKSLLVSLLQAGRMENQMVNPGLAKTDAQALYDAGEGRWGTNESVFSAILVSKSYAQLRATFTEYTKINGEDIVTAIDKETSGDYRKALKAIVLCVLNRNKFYALRLHRAMKTILRTDNATVIRVVVRRSECGMGDIKRQYHTMFKETLGDSITAHTSGDYRTTLLALIGNPEKQPTGEEKKSQE
uniref:Annexin A7-like isoform X1 n=1 Tax=Saccoglossus kowalevskii TaxID=10224 RepID=A0ABM0GUD5_SACKO|nr:PREDICTED: annexin A7-like isoform X1 [Saccoglossus kowalevskii]